jgi:hypothetical protein
MATIVGTGSGTLASLIPDLSDTSNIQTALKQLYYGTSNGTASQTTGIYGALYTLYTGNPTLAGAVTMTGRLSVQNVVNTSQTVETGTATLTAADILTKNIFTTGTTYTLTLDTGTNFDSALTIPTVGTTIEWVLINEASGTVTVAGATGHTLRGSGAVSTLTAARFITRKSATNTYVTYRL